MCCAVSTDHAVEPVPICCTSDDYLSQKSVGALQLLTYHCCCFFFLGCREPSSFCACFCSEHEDTCSVQAVIGEEYLMPIFTAGCLICSHVMQWKHIKARPGRWCQRSFQSWAVIKPRVAAKLTGQLHVSRLAKES